LNDARNDNPLLRVARASRKPGPLLLTAGLLALLAACLIAPIVQAIGKGFYDDGRLSFYWLGQTLSRGRNLTYLLNGLLLACATTGLALLIALPPAIVRARCRFRGQGVLGLLLLVPMILPPFVGALSMQHLFSQFGAFNLLLAKIGLLDFSRSLPQDWLGSGFAGVVVLQALHLFPILYLNASAALANVDPAYAQAARNLGAGPVRTFCRITLPLIRPGLFAGGTLVFIWSFTDIGTPLMIGYDQLAPVVIFKDLARSETSPAVYSLVFVLLSSSVTLYVLGKFLFGRALRGQTTKATVAAELHRPGRLATVGIWALFGTIIGVSLLPHVGVVLTAFAGRWVNTVLPSVYTLRHMKFVFARPQTYNTILNSLQYAGISTAIDLVFGCVAAWLIVRSKVMGRTVLDALVMLPLAVPGLILAAGYVALTATGPLKRFGPLGNPFVILVIAYAVRRLPFVARGVSAGLQQVSETLEEASRNLGATRVRTLWRITLPLIVANVIAAGVLTFAFAVLEVSDSLILAQKQAHFPITKAIYWHAASGNVDAANIASALGVYAMIFLGGTLALASALLGRRLGAIFRA